MQASLTFIRPVMLSAIDEFNLLPNVHVIMVLVGLGGAVALLAAACAC